MLARFSFLLPFVLLALVGTTEVASACKGCKNTSTEQECTTEDPEGPLWHDCEVQAGFCQFSGGKCPNEQDADTDLAADLKVTPAGTFIPVFTAYGTESGVLVRSCSGFVVSATDRVEERPQAIVLE